MAAGYVASNAPARGGSAVTPSDSANVVADWLYIGVGGNLALTMQDGSAVTLVNVRAGAALPVSVSQVKATGTTAGGIVAFWS